MSRITQNHSQCFTLEDLDIRGQVVQLEEVWQALHEQRGYSAQALRFLGELSCVAVLIGAGLKYPGRASLQIQRDRNHSTGTLLAIVNCTHQLGLRGMVNALEAQTAASFSDWVGDGTLAITLSRQASTQIYQSIVPISGLSVAECFEHYFDQSEQLPTHLWLAANEQGAGALLLQKLPGADEMDADGWARIEKLAASVSEAELISIPPAQLLQRLFYEEDYGFMIRGPYSMIAHAILLRSRPCCGHWVPKRLQPLCVKTVILWWYVTKFATTNTALTPP